MSEIRDYGMMRVARIDTDENFNVEVEFRAELPESVSAQGHTAVTGTATYRPGDADLKVIEKAFASGELVAVRAIWAD